MLIGKTPITWGQRLRYKGVLAAYMGKWHVDGGDYFGMGSAPGGWDPASWYDMRNFLEELTPKERVYSREISVGNTGQGGRGEVTRRLRAGPTLG
jgi:uncharacterized sulfatase